MIRPLRPEDREPLFDAVRESIATVGRWMSWCTDTYSRLDTEEWITRCQRNWASGSDREFGIFDSVSGEALGCVGINQINSVHRFANLGYWVRERRLGRGVAVSAARLAAKFAFQEMNLVRLEVVTRLENMASRRVAEKLGCQFEAIARTRIIHDDQAHEAAIYSLLLSDLTDAQASGKKRRGGS